MFYVLGLSRDLDSRLQKQDLSQYLLPVLLCFVSFLFFTSLYISILTLPTIFYFWTILLAGLKPNYILFLSSFLPKIQGNQLSSHFHQFSQINYSLYSLSSLVFSYQRSIIFTSLCGTVTVNPVTSLFFYCFLLIANYNRSAGIVKTFFAK